MTEELDIKRILADRAFRMSNPFPIKKRDLDFSIDHTDVLTAQYIEFENGDEISYKVRMKDTIETSVSELSKLSIETVIELLRSTLRQRTPSSEPPETSKQD